jgi:microcystin-dependent protein
VISRNKTVTPYIGQITLVAFNFAPQGWAVCDGSLLSIAQNAALFDLLGTTYGGDGQSTFALPDLRGRVPLHQGQGSGSNYVVGQVGGTESVTLSGNQIPSHTHVAKCVTGGSNSNSPVGGIWAQASADQPYEGIAAATAPMSPAAIGQTGGNQPHENRMPYEVLNYIIALQGIFPSQG